MDQTEICSNQRGYHRYTALEEHNRARTKRHQPWVEPRGRVNEERGHAYSTDFSTDARQILPFVPMMRLECAIRGQEVASKPMLSDGCMYGPR
jgi:hypothetical protein